MARSIDKGTYIPTTQTFDRSLIAQLTIDPALKNVLIMLYQATNEMASVLNTKESSLNIPEEFVTGARWYMDPTLGSTTPEKASYRQEYSKLIIMGALPNGTVSTTKAIAHGLTFDDNTTMVKITGVASKKTTAYSYIPIPYSSPTLAQNIQVDVDATNVTITVDASVDWSDYDTCLIVLHYLRQ